MGFDSRERDGRRGVSAALAGMHGCKGGTSAERLGTQGYICIYFLSVYGASEGKWRSTMSDEIITVSVRSECWKDEEEEGEEGDRG